MSVQNTNADGNDKSFDFSKNRYNNERQKELAEFDRQYLNQAEKAQIKELAELEEAQLKESSRYAAKTTISGVKAVACGPIGAGIGGLSMAYNSQKYKKSEDKLNEIAETQDKIRSEALERQNARLEKANEAASNIKNNSEAEDEMEVYRHGRPI